jgi:peptide deformylase
MSNFDIVTLGAPGLRMGCIPVEDVQNVHEHCQRMIALLRELNGAGLAAPQIGLRERIIVIEVRKTELFPERPESPLYVMINPEIIEASKEHEEGWEGCFSVPGLVGLVPRSKTIKVKYITSDGIERVETFEGYLARVVQHECDHLDGFVYLDRMKSMQSLSTLSNYKLFEHLFEKPRYARLQKG